MPACICGKWYHSNFDEKDNGLCPSCNGDHSSVQEETSTKPKRNRIRELKLEDNSDWEEYYYGTTN